MERLHHAQCYLLLVIHEEETEKEAVKEDDRVRSTEPSLTCSEVWVVSVGTDEAHRKQWDLI